MKVEEIVKRVIDLELIKSTDDIDYLFLNYPIVNNSLPLNENIQSAIQWAFENDELNDFFGEHYESLMDEPIIGCEMITASSIQTQTDFDLYQFESKNKYYFKVMASGEFADSWDWEYGFFDVVDKNMKKEVISNFKEECHEIFINHGEFDYDELIKDGHELLFS